MYMYQNVKPLFELGAFPFVLVRIMNSYLDQPFRFPAFMFLIEIKLMTRSQYPII